MSELPKCRLVTVHLFQGDRGTFGASVKRALDDQRDGKGNGPSKQDCLLYAGHTGVEVDDEPGVIWGFNPDIGVTPLWQAMQLLRNHKAYPGQVTDDTQVFAEAKKRKLKVLTIELVFPEPAYQEFYRKLTAERKQSQYTYGFPDGDGDCNCATWLERLALPLMSGSMDEFVTMTSSSRYPRRRFGECI